MRSVNVAIIDGRKVAQKRLALLQARIQDLQKNKKRIPKLSVILIGDDPASQTYVRSKERRAAELGFLHETHHLDKNITEDQVLQLIERLNEDKTIDGILLQLPLPNHLNASRLIQTIDYRKDVDGLHPINKGLLGEKTFHFVPCTAKGIMTLLKEHQIQIESQEALVIGRSDLVGKPIAQLLLAENATVTHAHSHTRDLKDKVQSSDILVVAVGKKDFIPSDWIHENQVVIDVGINRVDGKLYGDVSSQALDKAKWITPVPGGVGPMTIVSLLENTYEAYCFHEGGIS